MIYLIFLLFFFFHSSAHAATSVPFTIAMSEAVNVAGTPRIAVDVGGVTRYADYSAGTGTNALTFTYAMQAGDVDLDGVALSSPIDLNGGTITDTSGNPATLTFTPPDTSNIKINYPSLGMDFVADADGRYTLNGTVYDDLPAFLSATGGTFTRNSIGTYYDSTGTLQTATANTPRFDHDPVTHQPKGILIEEQRTNLLTRSSELDNAAWIKTDLTISSNSIIAPDGSSSADKLVEATTTSSHTLRGVVNLTSGNIYTFSFFAKSAGRNIVHFYGSGGLSMNGIVNLATGTILFGSVNISNAGNGWYRISASSSTTFTGANSIWIVTNNGSDTYTGDGTSGIYVWGAQLEQGSFPTSYIPTTTAAVTRAADDLRLNGLTIYPEYTAFTEFNQGFEMRNSARLIGFSNTSPRAAVTPISSTTLNHTAFNTTDGNTSSTTGLNRSIRRVASISRISPQSRRIVADGQNVVGDTGFTPMTSVMYIGSESGGGNFINTQLRKLNLYPSAITDTQLQLMTQ